MNKLIPCFLIMPIVASARMPPAMDQAQMQQMMQQMQNMQACVQNIDQAEMKSLEQRGRAMEKQVRQLCAQGKRDQAQSAAMDFAIQTANNPVVQEMKKCGEKMATFMPNMPQPHSFSSTEELRNRHVCDGM